MVRNWDTVRTILLRLEQAETANTFLNSKDITELPEQEVAYHMKLLLDEGFIEGSAKDAMTGDGKIAIAQARRLTWQGHDLLVSIRNDTIWTKVKEAFKAKGIEMTLDVVIKVANSIAASLLGVGD